MQKTLSSSTFGSTHKNIFPFISRYSLLLSIVEICLGSILHTLHIPLRGHFLSLNQCFILNIAVSQQKCSSKFIPLSISNTAALMKILSPSGKKITPMLAISLQGFLFNIGTLTFGRNIIGRSIGTILLSLWPFIQPTLIYLLVFGNLLFKMVDYYNTLINQIPWLSSFQIEFLIIGLVSIQICLALLVCIISSNIKEEHLKFYQGWLLKLEKQLPMTPKKNKKWRKLLSPFFIISLGLSFIFIILTASSKEEIFWPIIRIIAMSTTSIVILRSLPYTWFLQILKKTEPKTSL
jgi:hypothetical protein